MNAFPELWRAILGWLDLLTAQPDAGSKFNLSRMGLINALGFCVAAVLLVIAVESSVSGFPGWDLVLFSVLLNLVLTLAVVAVGVVTARLMRAEPLAMAVPIAYGMGLITLLALPLSYVGSGLVQVALLGVRGFMFYRAAREMGKLSLGISIAFAILCIAVLVAIPLGLYMLTGGGQGNG